MKSQLDAHRVTAALVDAGRLDEAVEQYRELLSRDKCDLRALAALRDIFKRLGNATELSDIYFRLAGCIKPEHRQRAFLEEAVRLNPASAEAVEMLASLMLAGNDLVSACHLFARTAKLYEGAGHAAATAKVREWIQEFRERLASAYAQHKERLALDPADRGAIAALAAVCSALGHGAEAAEHYTKLGDFLAQKGFALKALAVFGSALRHDAGVGEDLHEQRGNLYRDLGLKDEAADEYGKAARFQRRPKMPQ